MRPVAVLTGDLVGSTRAGPAAVAQSFAVLSDTLAGAEPWLDAPVRLTRFRGDGWQVLVDPPRRALRLALLLRARLRMAEDAAPARLAIGFGTLDHPGSHDLSDADGSALRHAGRALDTMPRRRLLVCAPEAAPAPLPPVVTLCDALAARWSAAQAEALALALPPDRPTQSTMAERLGISQQSLQERLDLAGFWALDEVLDMVETGADA